MSAAPIPELRSEERPPFYRDRRNARIIYQLAVAGLALGLLWWLYSNATTNIAASNMRANFDFLQQDFRQAIPGIEGAAQESVLRAYVYGYLNVLRSMAVGIPAATLIGIVVGIARLSDNLMVRAVGTVYVESLRNIPPLVIILFIYFFGLLEQLPQLEDGPLTPLDAAVVSNRTIAVPWLNPDASRAVFWFALLVAAVVTYGVVKWRGWVNAETGAPARGGLYGAGAFVIGAVAAHLVSGGALALDVPSVFVQDNGVTQVTGGVEVGIPYAGITIALTLYTASHIAEIVRGAIQAIAKGQTEAAQAVALSTYQRYRFVILPQAFRIMIPPLASQYLNYTKNTSLGVAVSFFELATVFQRLSANATPAILALLPMMGFYLTFSLGISLVANIFNRRLELGGRS